MGKAVCSLGTHTLRSEKYTNLSLMVVVLQRGKGEKVINFPPIPFIYYASCNSPFSRRSKEDSRVLLGRIICIWEVLQCLLLG